MIRTRKLSDRNRSAAEGRRVLQFTEEFDFNSSSNRKLVVAQVKHHIKTHNVEPVLVWVSLPCTGGTPCTKVRPGSCRS